MPHGTHHHIYVRHGRKITKKKATQFDSFVLFVSCVYPLSAVPQLIKIFQGNVEGVSLISWASFLFVSVVFLLYGLRHKVPPMIYCNIAWIFMDGAVVSGILINMM